MLTHSEADKAHPHWQTFALDRRLEPFFRFDRLGNGNKGEVRIAARAASSRVITSQGFLCILDSIGDHTPCTVVLLRT